MKILELNQKNGNNSIILKVVSGELEFRHLQGYIDQICMFATQTIKHPTKITKTGARHNFAKWFLLPAKLRTQLDADEYNFDDIKAGFVEYKDSIFFIYRVNKKITGKLSDHFSEKA